MTVSPVASLCDPEDLGFTSGFDGSVQSYVRMLPSGFDADHPADALVALHGHGSDRWQYARDPRGECRAARHFAATRRMIYVCPDYRASTSWMGPAAEADLVQLIALLRSEYAIDRVFLTGASMGGTSVLIFAALHPELVAGVSSQNGTASMVEYAGFPDAIAESYGGGRAQKPEEYRKRSPELVPERFTMPVAFAVGGRDRIVPPHSVRRLAVQLAIQDRKKVLIIDRRRGGHATNYRDTMKTLEFVLGAAAGGNPRAPAARREEDVHRGCA